MTYNDTNTAGINTSTPLVLIDVNVPRAPAYLVRRRLAPTETRRERPNTIPPVVA